MRARQIAVLALAAGMHAPSVHSAHRITSHLGHKGAMSIPASRLYVGDPRAGLTRATPPSRRRRLARRGGR